MSEVVTVVVLPVVAGMIMGAGLVWWAVTGLYDTVAGIHAAIRSANR
jgi:hypothetical protein